MIFPQAVLVVLVAQNARDKSSSQPAQMVEGNISQASGHVKTLAGIPNCKCQGMGIRLFVDNLSWMGNAPAVCHMKMQRNFAVRKAQGFAVFMNWSRITLGEVAVDMIIIAFGVTRNANGAITTRGRVHQSMMAKGIVSRMRS
mmetsp:Transcript_16365/g.31035  ORF Transcript_16365/g.31035 Transcript_16365/m.31035 type:complete len:143 (+) Transcript_16365:267-695(+)